MIPLRVFRLTSWFTTIVYFSSLSSLASSSLSYASYSLPYLRRGDSILGLSAKHPQYILYTILGTSLGTSFYTIRSTSSTIDKIPRLAVTLWPKYTYDTVSVSSGSIKRVGPTLIMYLIELYGFSTTLILA